MNIWNFEKPMNQNEQPSQYSIQMLFDPKKVDLSIMKAEAGRVAKEKFGNKLKNYMAASTWGNPFRDGNEKPDYEGYPKMVFVRTSSKFSIPVVDASSPPLIIEPPAPNEVDPIYAGAYYRATVRAHAYDFNGKRGVKFYLCTLQKLAEGESFGGARPDASTDFADGLEVNGGDHTPFDSDKDQSPDDPTGVF